MRTLIPTRRSPLPSALAVTLACWAVLGAGAGCVRKTAGPVAAKDDLSLSPRETDIVFMFNITRLRQAPLWKKLLDFRDKDPSSKSAYDDFVKRCQWDPQNQLDSIFVALPQNSGQTGEFAVLGRGKFTEAQLAACVRSSVKQSLADREITERDYHGHKILTVSATAGRTAQLPPGQLDPSTSFTVLGSQVAVLAGKAWIDRVVDLYDNRTQGNGARDHAELLGLMKRTRTGDAFWATGLVPPAVAERMKQNPNLGAASTVKNVSTSLDMDKGLWLHLAVDLATPQDAADQSGRINEQLASARKAPRVQLMGLTGYFDTIKVSSGKETLSAEINLSQQQVEDLIARLAGLLRGFSGDGF